MQFFKRNKKYLLFVLFILVIGIVLGMAYYFFIDEDIKLSIINTLNNNISFNNNFILKNLTIMSILLVLSFFIIGIPLSLFYLLYDSFSVGFLISMFFSIYKIKGLLYLFIYIILCKIPVLILMIIFIKKIIYIGKFIIGKIIYKKYYNYNDRIFMNFKKSLYIILFNLILNIIIYLISPLIFDNITFLLK